jgi:hypothetical protein
MMGRMLLSENDRDVVMMQHIFLHHIPVEKGSYQIVDA